jgi:hypothetical protein
MTCKCDFLLEILQTDVIIFIILQKHERSILFQTREDFVKRLFSFTIILFGLFSFLSPAQADIPITLVGQLSGIYGEKVAISGNYACVAGNWFCLQIIDISDPCSPLYVGSYCPDDPNFWIEDVAVSGNYAYVTHNNYDNKGFKIIDISDPCLSLCVGSFDTNDWVTDIAVSGSYAYVANGSSGLKIIDISNPNSPALIGSYDANGFTEKIVVSGNYAYASNSEYGLMIIDISNPFVPVYAGNCYYQSMGPDAIAVSGSYAYVFGRFDIDGQYLDGLHIIDVSNPAAPVRVGGYPSEGPPPMPMEGLAVSGNYAYLTGANTLLVLNVSNPASPLPVGSYNNIRSMPESSIAVSGRYVYTTCPVPWDPNNSYLKVLDVTLPVIPLKYVSRYPGNFYNIFPEFYYDTSAMMKNLSVSGSYACLIESYSHCSMMAGLFTVIDISNPASPIGLGYIADSNSSFGGVAVSGNYAFVTHYRTILTTPPPQSFSCLSVIDISDPCSPAYVGTCDIGTMNSFLSFIMPVAVSGNYAYVGCFYDNVPSLVTVDISDPCAPVCLGSFNVGPLAAWVRTLSIRDNLAFLAAGSAGLLILDISDPCQPVQLGAYDTNGTAIGVALSGNYAYVGDGSVDGLLVIDISDPCSPVHIGIYDTSSSARALAVSGNYACVPDYVAGLQIIDISNPASPAWINSCGTGGRAEKAIVSGSYIFVADDYGGLVICQLAPGDIDRDIDVDFTDLEIIADNWLAGFTHGDLDRDNDIDLFDFALFAGNWLRTDCSQSQGCSGTDFNADGTVDFQDIGILAANWLNTCCPKPQGCSGTDLNDDGAVDFSDFSVLAANWLLE